MLNELIKGLVQWIYSLFLELITYCANALLGVMSTDLAFFEKSVPLVLDLYSVFVAVGWGLLIGNCVFQCMKAMFAGLGFETESPYTLLIRTFLFGFLLVFSKDICEIGLSIGKKVIDIIGIPDSITLSMPTESFFTGNAAWLLVIIVGFIVGFQLIKLFFEIGERYVVVAILTLLCPVGLAMGGSKATKDICAGYIRTFASMIVLMVSNVLFLKLVLSALSAMPNNVMVLPWCLLVIGLAKTARKADGLLSKIGMNPAMTGDPLGKGGHGLVTAMMIARTAMAFASKGKAGGSTGNDKKGGSSNKGSKKHSSNNAVYNNSSNNNGSSNGGRKGNGRNGNSRGTKGKGRDNNSFQNSNTTSNSGVRFGSNSYGNFHNTENGHGSSKGGAGKDSRVNNDRFARQKQNAKGPQGNNSKQWDKKNGGKPNQQKSKPQNSSNNGNKGKGNGGKQRQNNSNYKGKNNNNNKPQYNGKNKNSKFNTPNKPSKNGTYRQNAKPDAPQKTRFGSKDKVDVMIEKDSDD